MAQLFATFAVLCVGGTAVAAFVTGNLWPAICAAFALRYLLKVFAALDTPKPAPPVAPRYHNGRKDYRMPS